MNETLEHQFHDLFPQAMPDDLMCIFDRPSPGKTLLKRAAVQTEDGFMELEVSAAELGSGLLAAVHSERSRHPGLMELPLPQRWDVLNDSMKRHCVFRRNGPPNSNLFTVKIPPGKLVSTACGEIALWVHNGGDRSLRFQMPDGEVYRVCAGYTECLRPANERARIDPIKVLLDLGDNPLDFCVSAVHVKYGKAPWRPGGIGCQTGTHEENYFSPVFCGDECLGVLGQSSRHFLESAQLELLDLDGYGPIQWYVRNKGEEEVSLFWPDPVRRWAKVPADGSVYTLETLAANAKEDCYERLQ